MKILVTGANGYLGSGIVKQLLDKGHIVIATDFKDDNIDKRSIVKLANIFDIEDPFSFFDAPDVILHLAWRDGFKHNSFNHVLDLSHHISFLCKMIDSGVKMVSILGSMHEIGYFEGCVDENTPCNPQSYYGICKNALRRIIELYCQNKNVLYQWLRGFYIVGNAEKGDSVFSKIVLAEKQGLTVFPFTTGQNEYDFLPYFLFCKYVASIVTQQKITGIINVCSGEPQKLCDVVENFIKENNYSIKLQYGAFPERKYDSKRIWGSNKKIKDILKNEK